MTAASSATGATGSRRHPPRGSKEAGDRSGSVSTLQASLSIVVVCSGKSYSSTAARGACELTLTTWVQDETRLSPRGWSRNDYNGTTETSCKKHFDGRPIERERESCAVGEMVVAARQGCQPVSRVMETCLSDAGYTGRTSLVKPQMNQLRSCLTNMILETGYDCTSLRLSNYIQEPSVVRSRH